MANRDVKGRSKPEARPHLYVTRAPLAVEYSARPAGGGSQEVERREDHEAHAQRLLKEYAAVWERATAEAQRVGRPPPTSVVVDVKGSESPAQPLALNRLSSPTQGLRLLAVRDVKGRPYATVAVERGKHDPLRRKLDEYADPQKETKSGLPKNNPLFVGIDSFESATLESRWTDTAEIPTDQGADGPWELWVDVEGRPERVVVATVRVQAAFAGVERVCLPC